MSKHNLSLEFDSFDELDSALYYAQNALKRLPQKENHGNYYSNLGYLILKTGGNKDSARYYMNKSLEELSIEGKSTTLKNLYDLEKENGDYKTANIYLEEHAAIIDSLYCMEQSTEIQQLIYEYNTKMRVREEQLKRKTHHILYHCRLCFDLLSNHTWLSKLYKPKETCPTSIQTIIRTNTK